MRIRRRLVENTRIAPWTIAAALFGGGIIFWGSFNWAMELTNTETFCISCHEMRENVYREYQQSAHYSNGSGVRATCPDCHVPREWTDKFVRKVGATNELFHTMLGSINTREKFLAKRMALAEHVWRDMYANDTLECRNCHELASMERRKQSAFAAKAHQKAQQQHRTCIDCHKGVAHELPEEFLDLEHERFEREDIDCGDCHAGLRREDDWGDEEW